jgi:hypothetical protein
VNCVSCAHPMVSDQLWRQIPKADRPASGLRAHRGRGLCSACQARARREGTLIDFETIHIDAMLEDAMIVVFECDVRQGPAVAERLGMTQDAFAKALRRAAARGDERAIKIRRHLPFMKEIA